MENNDIINLLNQYDKHFPTNFYKTAIEKFNEITLKDKLPEDKHILEGIRIFIHNSSKYNVYLCDKPVKNTIFRHIKLSEKGRKNLLKQILVLNNNNFDLMCSSETIKMKDIYAVISDKNIGIKVNNDCLRILFGIECLDFLEHQDLDRFCGYINLNPKKLQREPFKTDKLVDKFNDFICKEDNEFIDYTKIKREKNCDSFKDIKRSTEMFKKYYEFNRDLPQNIKQNLIVFSGFNLHCLGTTYTRDIDLIYYGEFSDEAEKKQLIDLFINNYDADVHFISSRECFIITKNGVKPARSYLYNWFMYGWPSIVGADSLQEVMVDPEYHFYFLGMKQTSIRMSIERMSLRGSPQSLVDLIMLKRINGYDTNPCLHNLVVRQGKIYIYNDKVAENMLNLIQKFIKQWHGIDIKMSEIRDIVRRCSEKPYEVYKTKAIPDNYTRAVNRYHNQIMTHFLNYYARDKKILDVGCGYFRSAVYYERAGALQMVGIEPSSHTFSLGLEKIKEWNLKIKVNGVNGSGEESWKLPKYKDVLEHKPYDLIVFSFSIHYMVHKFKDLLENIKLVDGDKTRIIITCLDGDLIQKHFDKYRGKIIINIGDDPHYGIFKFNNQILVYFKGVTGVEKGSVENLVFRKDIESNFNNYGYKIIEEVNYGSINKINNKKLSKIYYKLHLRLKYITNYHKIYILEKN